MPETMITVKSQSLFAEEIHNIIASRNIPNAVQVLSKNKVEAENMKLRQVIKENTKRDVRVEKLEQKNIELETRLAILEQRKKENSISAKDALQSLVNSNDTPDDPSSDIIDKTLNSNDTHEQIISRNEESNTSNLDIYQESVTSTSLVETISLKEKVENEFLDSKYREMVRKEIIENIKKNTAELSESDNQIVEGLIQEMTCNQVQGIVSETNSTSSNNNKSCVQDNSVQSLLDLFDKAIKSVTSKTMTKYHDQTNVEVSILSEKVSLETTPSLPLSHTSNSENKISENNKSLPETDPKKEILIRNESDIDTLILFLQQKYKISKKILDKWKADVVFEFRDNTKYWKEERESMPEADFLKHKKNFEAKMGVPTTPYKKELKNKSLALIEYA
ncbi:36682_t:CDS:2 [Gigaspora margarita]|uniref:36682_t:CDS:1 n=1 Tax=Gigaspora margarita TaxID=4874 RepID=A0ABM8VYY9_GIGMA|nr:36682_t:CDS:2 [Gigaspora margarita]